MTHSSATKWAQNCKASSTVAFKVVHIWQRKWSWTKIHNFELCNSPAQFICNLNYSVHSWVLPNHRRNHFVNIVILNKERQQHCFSTYGDNSWSKKGDNFLRGLTFLLWVLSNQANHQSHQQISCPSSPFKVAFQS